MKLRTLFAVLTGAGLFVSPAFAQHADLLGRTGAYNGVYSVTAGAIVTAGVSQQALAPNPSRQAYMLCNTSSAAMAYNFVAAASATTFPLAVGQCVSSGTFVSIQQINVWGATAGQTFIVAEGN